ncbi:alpha/beta fold hydrolase [Stenotrophomonas rhizophila]|uniref:Alpha/beta fold hydrolase n=1 Tax=Stenotrophomonas nematodicola TaxID=2656746 RepID=A0ABW7CU48_9GAMM
MVLLHGVGDTGDTWAPLATAFAARHTVVVLDLRRTRRSSHPADGYDKHVQGGDVRALLASLGSRQATVMGHDIGSMVAFA